MILTLKNLQQNTFTIEIDAQSKVLELKKEIFKKLGEDYLVERQKLIYSGVVLLDERTLASYNVDEKKFIVVMLTRGNAPTSNEPNNVDVAENSRAENVPTISNEPLGQPSVDVESAFVAGEEYNRAINVLMEMGFSRESVERSMAASFNNPERAFDYLVNGIPENIDNEPGNDVGMNTIREVLELLRNNPTLLRRTLEQIGLTDPNLIQQVINNPDAFFNLLNQSLESPNNTSSAQTAANQEILAQLPGIVNGMTPNTRGNISTQPQAGTENINQLEGAPNLLSLPRIPLTHSDQDAIERIKAMGFSEENVVQAYIACEKNEELTVHFLLSNSDE